MVRMAPFKEIPLNRHVTELLDLYLGHFATFFDIQYKVPVQKSNFLNIHLINFVNSHSLIYSHQSYNIKEAYSYCYSIEREGKKL